MFPQVSRGRAPLMRMFLGIVLCASFFLAQAIAFQTQIQLHTNEAEAGRKVKTRVVPEYPELAIKTKITGTVRVELTVTPEGTVKDVKELGGNPVLLAALVHAVKQWKYEAASKESVVEVKAAFSERL
jgi:TonB family protein